MKAYREKLIMTYKELINFYEELLTHIVNVGMIGKWAEVNQTFELGDTYKFDIEQFRDSSLNKLIAFYNNLEILMNSLANLNAITEEELDDEDDED